MDFWHYVYLIFWFALFMIWIFIVFQIVTDLMRDHQTSGIVKAVWVIALILIPFVTALVYLIVNGKKMAERQREAIETAKAAQDTYIRSAVQASPSDQIAQAKQLFDSGVISEAEYLKLKERALS